MYGNMIIFKAYKKWLEISSFDFHVITLDLVDLPLSKLSKLCLPFIDIASNEITHNTTKVSLHVIDLSLSREKPMQISFNT